MMIGCYQLQLVLLAVVSRILRVPTCSLCNLLNSELEVPPGFQLQCSWFSQFLGGDSITSLLATCSLPVSPRSSPSTDPYLHFFFWFACFLALISAGVVYIILLTVISLVLLVPTCSFPNILVPSWNFPGSSTSSLQFPQFSCFQAVISLVLQVHSNSFPVSFCSQLQFPGSLSS